MACTFFAMQLAMKAPRTDARRKALYDAIHAAGAEQTLFEKRSFYTRLAGLLGEALSSVDLCFWDYVATKSAEKDYETWSSQIETAVAGDRENPRLPAGSQADYILVTTLFLLKAGSDTDKQVAARCDVPEAAQFSADTLQRLITTIPTLNFGSVQGDAVYVVPGPDRSGLSEDEIRGEGYEYLKPVF